LIEFRKTSKQFKILNPLKNFEEDSTTFEYRADPLTGRNTTVIKSMLGYVSKYLVSDPTLLKTAVNETQASCPFCPERVNSKTPKFTKDFLLEGRIISGEATIVPNLLGHAEQSALAILSKKHYLTLREFKTKLLVDGFKGAMAYLKRLHEANASIRYPIFAFNYLPPAGSSIFHPHMQILVRDRPFYLAELMIQKSKEYREQNDSKFWSDLIKAEKKGERYLYRSYGVDWLVPFAPLRGLNEVQAIVEGKSSFMELEDPEWLGLAEGVSKVLGFYGSLGYSCFNIIIISGPMDSRLSHFDVNLRIISRPGIQQWSFTDAWAAPYMLWDGEAVEEPEVFAEKARIHFRKRSPKNSIDEAKIPDI